MASELRAKALEADDIEEEIVPVDQWDIKLLVKGMSGGDRAKFLKRTSRAGEALSAKSGAALELIAAVALRLSGMGQAAITDAAASLGEAPSEGST